MKRSWLLVLISVSLAGCVSEERLAEETRISKRVEIHTQLGAGYIQRNQLDVALQELEQALALDPDNSQANNVMGLLQIRLKNDSEAERYYRRAIETQPSNAEAHNNYGVFLCERGRLDDARREFDEALANPLYPTPELANVNAGTCLMRRAAPQAAAGYFRAALRSNPKSASALSGLAQISHDRGDHLSARGFLQRYFEVGPDTPEVLWLAIEVEQALGSGAASNRYAARLRSKFPDSREAKRLGHTGG